MAPMTSVSDDPSEAPACPRAGGLAPARGLFCARLPREPAHPPAWRLLGETALDADEPAVAVECLEHAWAGHFNDASFHAQLARAYHGMKRYEQAEDCYAKALNLDPDNDDWDTSLARVLVDMGKL